MAEAHPARKIEAINASGVSYAMHRLNIVADELLRYEPDVFIVYSGHNEFVEPARQFTHRDQHRSGDLRQLKLPWLSDVQNSPKFARILARQ